MGYSDIDSANFSCFTSTNPTPVSQFLGTSIIYSVTAKEDLSLKVRKIFLVVKQWFDMNKFFSLWIKNCYIGAERPPVSNGLHYIFGAFYCVRLLSNYMFLRYSRCWFLKVYIGLYMLAIFKLIFFYSKQLG